MINTECGIYSIISKNDISKFEFINGLKKLQHRGRDSFGITYSKNNTLYNFKYNGLINNNINIIENEYAKIWLGHVRYTTNGKLCNEQIQPIKFNIFLNEKEDKNFSLAFNGNIPIHIFNKIYKTYPYFKIMLNNIEKQQKLNDTLILIEFIKYIYIFYYLKYGITNNNIVNTIIDILNIIDGAFTILLIDNEKCYIFKDKYGIRPCTILKHINNNIIHISSESCVLDNYNDYFTTNIEPNTLYCIDYNSLNINILHQNTYNTKQCIFEYLYFLNVNTINNNISTTNFRTQIGIKLAQQIEKEHIKLYNTFKNENVIVCGVPKSGLLFSYGFSEYTNIKYEQFLDLKNNNDSLGGTNNNNHERTFILNSQEKRLKACKNKYEIKTNIENKICILIDDSIVRGTTLKYLINYIKSFKPLKIHFISGSPSIKFPCNYGVDFADIEDLYFNKSQLDISKNTYFNIDNIDSLTYLSLDNLNSVFNNLKNNNVNTICSACFDGKYLF